ncbi:MAG: hypothetical protein SNJ77_05860 [Cytophagales bacterium]
MEKVVKKTTLSEIKDKAEAIRLQLIELKQLESNVPFWVFLCLGIEFLGSFLDDKPLYAENQSRSRFYISIAKLFPNRYYVLNKKDFLFKNLRCILVHRMMLTKMFVEGNKHLELLEDNTIAINKDMAIEDFKLATEKLIIFLSKSKQ